MAATAFQRSGEPWRAPPDEGSRAETSGKRSLGRPYSQSGIYIHCDHGGSCLSLGTLCPYTAGALEWLVPCRGPGAAVIQDVFLVSI